MHRHRTEIQRHTWSKLYSDLRDELLFSCKQSGLPSKKSVRTCVGDCNNSLGQTPSFYLLILSFVARYIFIFCYLLIFEKSLTRNPRMGKKRGYELILRGLNNRLFSWMERERETERERERLMGVKHFKIHCQIKFHHILSNSSPDMASLSMSNSLLLVLYYWPWVVDILHINPAIFDIYF